MDDEINYMQCFLIQLRGTQLKFYTSHGKVTVKKSFPGKVHHGTIIAKTTFGRDNAQKSESVNIQFKLFWEGCGFFVCLFLCFFGACVLCPPYLNFLQVVVFTIHRR